MRLLVRFLNFLNVLLATISAPIYAYFAKLPRKPLPAKKHPKILNLSATSIAEKIRTKQLTSEEVVKAYIERCQQVNPLINAISEDRYEAAVVEAKQVDLLIRSNEKTAEQIAKQTPLLGVPISVKESLRVKGSSLTVGAQLRKGVRATEDGAAVALLRNAGAIPIAVTNVPELCTAFETRNNLIGYTCNPYDPNRTSGGSSGGESALISSAGSVLGLGSDLGGSIRVPSLFCGIFGHKPTSGIVPMSGHFPGSSDQHFLYMASKGPLCRYAEDLKLSMTIMAGPKNAEKLKLDQKVNLNELKIYYMFDNGLKLSEISVDYDIKKTILNAANYFKNTHECSVQRVHLAALDNSLEMIISKVNQMKDMESILILKDRKEESGLLMEFIKLLMNKASYTLEVLIMRLYIKICPILVPKNKQPKYLLALKNLATHLEILLQEDGVLFYPTFASVACYRQQSVWRITSLVYPMIVNALGFPATHVPMGLNENGIPVGFQVIAAPNQDRLCFAVAEELEKAFGGWVSPPMSF